MRVDICTGYEHRKDRRRCEPFKERLYMFDRAIGRNACAKAWRRLLAAHADAHGSRASRAPLKNARQVFRIYFVVRSRFPSS